MNYPYSTTPGTPSDTPKLTRPFSVAWEQILERGWEVVPLPPLAKAKPLDGTTGRDGKPLSAKAIQAIATDSRSWNIAVRPPKNVIGIDVDAYKAKQGGVSLATLEAKLGRLPLTVVTSRRFPENMISGIRWFRLPEGVTSDRWPGVVGHNIDMIRHGYRYGTCPPSAVYEDDATGTGPILTYRALDQESGNLSLEMPWVEDLPFLPQAWIDYLDSNASLPWAPQGEAVEWLTNGDCARVNEQVAKFTPATLNGSRHDAMRDVVFAIARLGASGHDGTLVALERLKFLFLEATEGEPRREAEKEFIRAVEPTAWRLNDVQKQVCHGMKCGVIEDMSERLGVEPKVEPEVRLEIQFQTDPMVEVAKWLWEGRVPLGELTLLAGREGLGKSTMAIHLAAEVTKGALAGEFRGQPKNVIIVATEDSWTHTLNPRLIAAGADMNRIATVKAHVVNPGQSNEISLPNDAKELLGMMIEHDVKLLLLDPLMSRISSKLDTHKDAEARIALEAMAKIAHAAGAAVLGLIHFNKSTQTKNLLDRVMASKAFTAVPRSVLAIGPHPETDSHLVLDQLKSNLGPISELLAFTIEPVDVPTTDGIDVAKTSRVKWDPLVTFAKGTTLAELQEETEAFGMAELIAQEIRAYLQLNGGTALSSDVLAFLAEKKLKASNTTMVSARKRAGITAKPGGFGRPWIWSLTP